MLNKLFHSNKITLTFKGESINKFLNMVIYNKIGISIIEKKDDSLIIEIGLKDFKKVIKIAKRNKLKFHITKKKGIYFILRELTINKLITIIACAIIFYLCGLFIVEIKIENKDSFDDVLDSKIISQLKQYNIRPFIMKSHIDEEEISKRLVIDINQILWAKIQKRGCILRVEYSKRGVYYSEEKRGKIIAGNNGVIYKMIVKSGNPLVKEGDTVIKGQVIIDNKVVTKDGEKYYEDANAEVIALTWYKVSGAYNISEYKKVYLSDKVIPFMIIGKKEIIPKFIITKNQKYDKIKLKELKILNKNLSIGLYRINYYKMVRNIPDLSRIKDKIVDKCDEVFLTSVKDKKIIKIGNVSTKIKAVKEKNRIKQLWCTRIYECYEDIAQKSD